MQPCSTIWSKSSGPDPLRRVSWSKHLEVDVTSSQLKVKLRSWPGFQAQIAPRSHISTPTPIRTPTRPLTWCSSPLQLVQLLQIFIENEHYTAVLFTCSLYFKKGLKHMRFNSRINLPIIYFKLLCNTRHKAWPCYHQDHVRVSVHIHRGKQLSKWFTAVLNCDDFLNCGYKEELLVIICKNNFCGFLFFYFVLNYVHMCPRVNMLKPMKLHQLKQYLNRAYVWPIINKIECNYASLIISSRALLHQYKWGVGVCLWMLQAEPKNEKMSPEMLCRDSLWKFQVSPDAYGEAVSCYTSKNVS